MKILLTANTAWNIAHFRAGLTEALTDGGHELIALSPNDQGVVRLGELGVRHVPIHIDPKGTQPIRDARLIHGFRQVFRRERPDVILSYTIKNNIYGGIAARSLGIPFVPNVSGLGTAFLSTGALEKVVTILYRSSFRSLTHVVFQNADDRDLFAGRGIIRHEQAILVPGSGVDLDRFCAGPLPICPQKSVTFLLIARLLRDKGVEEFVEAARMIRMNHPEARFQLLGEAGAANRTAIPRTRVDGWVDEGVVEYLGVTEDVRPFIARADCVVLPSYREGTPRTLLEAAAMGRPLVATNVPGCREVVDEGVTGLLCQVKNAPDLARALRSMIEIGPEARTAFGQAGRAKMEREFDQSIVIGTYRDIIAGLVA